VSLNLRPLVAAGRRIGPSLPVFVIAEAGVNHDGDLDRAKRLAEVAASAGADAVKFQTFNTGRLVSAAAGPVHGASSPAASHIEMLRRLELPAAAHLELVTHCRHLGITFLSTPFDEESADLLETLDVPAFKISSGDITNVPLLEHVARKYRPVFLSTGMSSHDEVAAAVGVVRAAGNEELALLHCVSTYPADPADCNLRVLETMAVAFGVPVGYSDHTLGIEIAVAAVALGACIIEKHFTLDRRSPGPDHHASLEPAELAALVRAIRNTEAALGHGRKEAVPNEAVNARLARRSLVAARDIPVGTRLTRTLIAVKRPGTGLPPAMLPSLLGRIARVDVPADCLLTPDLFE
jgi:N,N'-diacetyllegionaminate synthase